jgi:peptidoglycan/LPS O-acetylase OafA/YrhL
VTLQGTAVDDERFLPSGDEAGTSPDDRRFRPDVEGLRAVAVLVVVLYHAGVPGLGGGFVGVDVFFVISGFVITGLLLRERERTGTTSVLGFYARRVRRILPAGTLVILVTVASSYLVLGALLGNNVADDGRWAAIFLSNVHFESVGTNYLAASLPPSPLQNYWSLSVEEQFYVVYPTVFLLVARLKVLTFRSRMAVALGLVALVSFGLSIFQTASHPLAAYFSPFTRAWELALGGLVALGTSWLRRIPSRCAVLLTWAGLAAVMWSAFLFNAQTPYPGWVVALPVVGAALVIAGGVAIPAAGAESLLGLPPFQWLGRRSYSLYLWHWPILIIAAERVGRTQLPVDHGILLVLLALVVSVATYRVVENPVRHWRLPAKQSVVLGLGVILITVAVLTVLIRTVAPAPAHASSSTAVVAVAAQTLKREVVAAPRIISVPTSVARSGYGAYDFWGGAYEPARCQAEPGQSREQICNLGDPRGTRLLVVYGDSHALMWIPAFTAIARAEHWRLVVLGKWACPANRVSVGFKKAPQADPTCDAWHRWAMSWINQNHPDLLVFTQADFYSPPGSRASQTTPFTAAEWRHGFDDLVGTITVPRSRMVLLGSTPILAQVAPVCLAAHPSDVQLCSSPASVAVPALVAVDRSAARADHVAYIDTVPWFCTSVCSPIIGEDDVYDVSGDHISGTRAMELRGVLGQALGLSPGIGT